LFIDTEAVDRAKYNDQIPFKIVECRARDRMISLTQFARSSRAGRLRSSSTVFPMNMNPISNGMNEMVQKMGWQRMGWHGQSRKPRASKLISGMLKIKVPLIFTFRAREKNQAKRLSTAKKVVINIGWQPVAPLENCSHADLTCILPPRADGVPVWHSNKIGEDFIDQAPNYLRPFVVEGKPFSRRDGRRFFATWAKGGIQKVLRKILRTRKSDSDSDDLMAWDSKLATASHMGMPALQEVWATVPAPLKRN